MSCVRALYDHTPFDPQSRKGGITAVAKRGLIGLIGSVALAAIIYFSVLSLYSVLNPLMIKQSMQIDISAGVACFFGLFGLAISGAWMFAAREDYCDNISK